jgi:pilin isopeptide linkage protein
LKKAIIFLLTGAVMLVTLCLLPFSAFAAETVSVSIPIEIEGGGTAVLITEVNCPLPESSSVEVKDGATENINISFTTPGDYEYTVKAEAKDGLYYSPEYYTAAVAVRTDSSGELAATVVLTKADSDYKPAKCRFELTEKPTEAPKTESAAPEQAPKEPPTSRPKTGDDSMLDIYLLICIFAAGGLFMLAVIYSVSTDRLIGRK